jgi:hypothetical protein
MALLARTDLICGMPLVNAPVAFCGSPVIQRLVNAPVRSMPADLLFVLRALEGFNVEDDAKDRKCPAPALTGYQQAEVLATYLEHRWIDEVNGATVGLPATAAEAIKSEAERSYTNDVSLNRIRTAVVSEYEPLRRRAYNRALQVHVADAQHALADWGREMRIELTNVSTWKLDLEKVTRVSLSFAGQSLDQPLLFQCRWVGQTPHSFALGTVAPGERAPLTCSPIAPGGFRPTAEALQQPSNWQIEPPYVPFDEGSINTRSDIDLGVDAASGERLASIVKTSSCEERWACGHEAETRRREFRDNHIFLAMLAPLWMPGIAGGVVIFLLWWLATGMRAGRAGATLSGGLAIAGILGGVGLAGVALQSLGMALLGMMAAGLFIFVLVGIGVASLVAHGITRARSLSERTAGPFLLTLVLAAAATAGLYALATSQDMAGTVESLLFLVFSFGLAGLAAVAVIIRLTRTALKAFRRRTAE